MNVQFLDFMDSVAVQLGRTDERSKSLVTSALKAIEEQKKILAEENIIKRYQKGLQKIEIKGEKGNAWFHAWGSKNGEPCAICENEYGSIVLVRAESVQFVR